MACRIAQLVSFRSPHSSTKRSTHRALILHQEQHAMSLPLGELLQDMHKVDDGEEVAPRVVSDELDLVVLGAGGGR